MGVGAFDTVLITGLGPVGLGGDRQRALPWSARRGGGVGAMARRASAARWAPRPCWIRGSSDLLRADSRSDRRAGVDCALDCSGTVPAERLCIDAARRKGKVAFVGECSDDLAIRISPDMIRKGLTLIGSWHYNLSYYPLIMQVIQKSPLIDLLVSHVFPMSRIQEAFEVSASHECAKILLKPWE